MQLPNPRRAMTCEGTYGKIKLFVTVGFFDDGAPAEVFLSTNGPEQSPALDAWAIAASLAMQHGCEWPRLKKKLTSGLMNRVAELIDICVGSEHEATQDLVIGSIPPDKGRFGGNIVEDTTTMKAFSDNTVAYLETEQWIWRA